MAAAVDIAVVAAHTFDASVGTVAAWLADRAVGPAVGMVEAVADTGGAAALAGPV